jgi:hypothetical protein
MQSEGKRGSSSRSGAIDPVSSELVSCEVFLEACSRNLLLFDVGWFPVPFTLSCETAFCSFSGDGTSPPRKGRSKSVPSSEFSVPERKADTLQSLDPTELLVPEGVATKDPAHSKSKPRHSSSCFSLMVGTSSGCFSLFCGLEQGVNLRFCHLFFERQTIRPSFVFLVLAGNVGDGAPVLLPPLSPSPWPAHHLLQPPTRHPCAFSAFRGLVRSCLLAEICLSLCQKLDFPPDYAPPLAYHLSKDPTSTGEFQNTQLASHNNLLQARSKNREVAFLRSTTAPSKSGRFPSPQKHTQT